MGKGRITIPTDRNFVEETKEIMKKWGADAIRDCDGTTMPEHPEEFAEKVYNTVFVVRGDNEWAKANLDELQHFYLISDVMTATEDTFKINLMDGYYDKQLAVEYDADPHKYWEVIDRTSGDIVEDWQVDKDGFVVINNARFMHEYTVSFLAKNLWDTTHMYNSKTNGWDEEPHIDYNPYYPKTKEYIKRHLQEWCDEHTETNVVRFTTFIYHFMLVANELGKEKRVDWFGYAASVSPKLIDDFEAEYGYKLRPEYLVVSGRYASPFVNPTPQFLDYMDFVERYVTDTVAELVDIVHKNGKEAMMFLGDTWIGAEPYGEYFEKLGLDAVVGSVGGGVTVRMLSEIPYVKYREGRFLPYFFPDTFYEGNDPTIELNKNWMTARRAIMRKPLDRIGYGGYLQLAAKFPKFIDRVAEICDEFRGIYDAVDNKKPHSALKVAVLNAWGKKRSWMSHMVAHELWYQQIYSYQGVFEALSGLPVEVEFISFDDVKKGIAKDIDVIINAGDAYTAFSGGEKWLDDEVITNIRSFIYSGGGFIGVGEPSAIDFGGKFFQLAEALGVDKELGLTLSDNKYNIQKADGHFVLEDIVGEVDYGEDKKNIYAKSGATVLDIKFSDRFIRNHNVGEVKMAVNEYGKGRCFYITGIPYSFQNARLLYRAMLWTSHKEAEINKCFSDNINTDCNYYPHTKKYAIINNSEEKQTTTFYDINGKATKLDLLPMEIRWIEE